LSPSCC